MKKASYILIFALALSFSCDKDPGRFNSRDEIIAGNPYRMVITRYDTLLVGGYNQLRGFNLDIDGDLTPDFLLTSEVWGSPGMGQYPRAKIMSLDPNALINCREITDTTFYRMTVDTSYGENWTPVMISYTYSRTCDRVNPKDSIISVKPDVFVMRHSDAGEYILGSEPFKADTLVLNDETYGQSYSPIYRNDTIINRFDYYHYSCHSLPNDLFRYIGIKLIRGKEEQLGWIKLGVMNSYKIMILETALFK
jgi:hypothetical protein